MNNKNFNGNRILVEYAKSKTIESKNKVYNPRLYIGHLSS